ncbi:MAG: transposase [Dehalococcoidia bacterium]
MDRLDQQTPLGQTIHLILDPVSLHHSAEVAVWLAGSPWRPFVFHWLPKHASWLSFVEVWFATLRKKCLKRSEFATAAVA